MRTFFKGLRLRDATCFDVASLNGKEGTSLNFR